MISEAARWATSMPRPVPPGPSCGCGSAAEGCGGRPMYSCGVSEEAAPEANENSSCRPSCRPISTRLMVLVERSRPARASAVSSAPPPPAAIAHGTGPAPPASRCPRAARITQTAEKAAARVQRRGKRAPM
ncbi:hypothetical protein DP939_16775 [Spongiactinospora rosea]|uniref:Uncharacterized protein n=1 Tax=Spongiactinospora rosea TaxID=2248750 RepID=A0A366LY05_9ACTN|nr:hypothetical protein DP939_16775 [Spongiactinospora rosea]